MNEFVWGTSVTNKVLYESHELFVVTAFNGLVLRCFRLNLTAGALCSGTEHLPGRNLVRFLDLATISDWHFWNDNAWPIDRLATRAITVVAGRLSSFASFLPFPLMGQYLLFMLLEADEVEMQIFNAVFFKQVLSDEAIQVYSSLCKRIILVKWRSIPLDCTEVASIVAHIKWGLLIGSERVI